MKTASAVLLFLYVFKLARAEDCDVRMWYLKMTSKGVFDGELSEEKLFIQKTVNDMVLNSKRDQAKRKVSCDVLEMYEEMLKPDDEGDPGSTRDGNEGDQDQERDSSINNSLNKTEVIEPGELPTGSTVETESTESKANKDNQLSEEASLLTDHEDDDGTDASSDDSEETVDHSSDESEYLHDGLETDETELFSDDSNGSDEQEEEETEELNVNEEHVLSDDSSGDFDKIEHEEIPLSSNDESDETVTTDEDNSVESRTEALTNDEGAIGESDRSEDEKEATDKDSENEEDKEINDGGYKNKESPIAINTLAADKLKYVKGENENNAISFGTCRKDHSYRFDIFDQMQKRYGFVEHSKRNNVTKTHNNTSHGKATLNQGNSGSSISPTANLANSRLVCSPCSLLVKYFTANTSCSVHTVTSLYNLLKSNKTQNNQTRNNNTESTTGKDASVKPEETLTSAEMSSGTTHADEQNTGTESGANDDKNVDVLEEASRRGDGAVSKEMDEKGVDKNEIPGIDSQTASTDTNTQNKITDTSKEIIENKSVNDQLNEMRSNHDILPTDSNLHPMKDAAKSIVINKDSDEKLSTNDIAADTTVSNSETTDTTVSKSETADTTVSKSETADTTVSNSETADTPVSKSETADTTVSYSETADTTVIKSETADTPVSNSETADTTVSNSETADTTVSKSETADTAISNSETADTRVSNSETADTTVSNSETADTRVSNSETADTTVSNSETADTTVSNSEEKADTTVSKSEIADTPVSKSEETADTAVSNSETADTTVSNSETADTRVSNSETADTTVSNSETADTTVSNSEEKADTTVSKSETADTPVSKSEETADTAVSNSETADTTVSNSETADTTISKSEETVDTTVSKSETADTTVSKSEETADTTVSKSETADTTVSKSEETADTTVSKSEAVRTKHKTDQPDRSETITDGKQIKPDEKQTATEGRQLRADEKQSLNQGPDISDHTPILEQLQSNFDQFQEQVVSKTDSYSNKLQNLELMVIRLENQLLKEKLNKSNHSSTITRMENHILRLENELLKLNQSYSEVKKESDSMFKDRKKYLQLGQGSQQTPAYGYSVMSGRPHPVSIDFQAKIGYLTSLLNNQSMTIRQLKTRSQYLEDQNRLLYNMIMNQTALMTQIMNRVQDLTEQNIQQRIEAQQIRQQMEQMVSRGSVGETTDKFLLNKLEEMVSDVQKRTLDEDDKVHLGQIKTPIVNKDKSEEELEEYMQNESVSPTETWCGPSPGVCTYATVVTTTCVPFSLLQWKSCAQRNVDEKVTQKRISKLSGIPKDSDEEHTAKRHPTVSFSTADIEQNEEHASSNDEVKNDLPSTARVTNQKSDSAPVDNTKTVDVKDNPETEQRERDSNNDVNKQPENIVDENERDPERKEESDKEFESVAPDVSPKTKMGTIENSSKNVKENTLTESKTDIKDTAQETRPPKQRGSTIEASSDTGGKVAEQTLDDGGEKMKTSTSKEDSNVATAEKSSDEKTSSGISRETAKMGETSLAIDKEISGKEFENKAGDLKLNEDTTTPQKAAAESSGEATVEKEIVSQSPEQKDIKPTESTNEENADTKEVKETSKEPTKEANDQVKEINKESAKEEKGEAKDQNKEINKEPAKEANDQVKEINKEPAKEANDKVKEINKESAKEAKDQVEEINKESAKEAKDQVEEINKESAKEANDQVKEINKESAKEANDQVKEINKESAKEANDQVKEINKESAKEAKDQVKKPKEPEMELPKDKVPDIQKEQSTNEIPKAKKNDEAKVKVKSQEKKPKEPLKKPIKYEAVGQKEPKDCFDYHKRGKQKNGVFKIKPHGKQSMVEVFCDMKNGGWTVIHKRQDGTTKFLKKWQDYKEGFGGIRGEHWLGNEYIHYLTNQDHYTLRIELTDWNKTKRVAEYDYFMIDDESEGYRLHIGGYHGDAGDGMAKHNNNKFSTIDVDNDKVTKEFGGSCAKRFSGAWWYYKCYASNLNGIYYRNGVIPHKMFDGVAWKPWTGSNYSLRSAEMKIRPSNIS